MVVVRHKLGRVSTPDPRVRRSTTASVALVALVALAIAVLLAACSDELADQVASNAPSAHAQDAIQTATQPAVVRKVFASVLIVEADEKRAGSIERVVVSPEALLVDRGEVVQLSARAFDEDGLPATGADLVYAMTDVRAGSVRADGVFTAGRMPGTYPAAITVTMVLNIGGDIHHASAGIQVTVVGEEEIARLSRIELIPEKPTVLEGQLYRLRAFGYDENGLVIPGTSFEWSVNDPALGVVNRIGYLTVHGGPGTFPGGVGVTATWNGSDSVLAKDDARDESQAPRYSASNGGSPTMRGKPLLTQMKRFNGSASNAGTAKSFGGAGGTRTLYLFNAIEALSQMSYSPTQYGLWAAINIAKGHPPRKNGLTTGAGLAIRPCLKYNPGYDTGASEHFGGSVSGDFAGAGVWKRRRGCSHAIARANSHGHRHAHSDSHPHTDPDTNADPVAPDRDAGCYAASRGRPGARSW